MIYFSANKHIDADQFVKEFISFESRDNFLHYWDKKMHDLKKREIITHASFIAHQTNRNRLIAFNGGSEVLIMADITPDFIKQYQKWLRKKRIKKVEGKDVEFELSYNTSINALKVLSTYIHHAQDDGFNIKNPFGKITLAYKAADREALDREELTALKELFEKNKLDPVEREVLRKFLFSCYCGIRISDNALIYRSQIVDGVLSLHTKKGRNQGKHISIPLPHYARELIKDRTDLLFDKISDQKCNMWLKVIAHKANITKKLTFHVSRDTFATLFIELGGDVVTLKEVLGHSDIKTTMIYVKMHEKVKEKAMSKFDSL
jgi:site-specific recombinase XerD